MYSKKSVTFLHANAMLMKASDCCRNTLIYWERISLSMVLKLHKQTEPLRSCPRFCRSPFVPNITESKNGLHVSDYLRRTPETAPSNPWDSIEPS